MFSLDPHEHERRNADIACGLGFFGEEEPSGLKGER